jgi:hypothetical protein
MSAVADYSRQSLGLVLIKKIEIIVFVNIFCLCKLSCATFSVLYFRFIPYAFVFVLIFCYSEYVFEIYISFLWNHVLDFVFILFVRNKDQMNI